jgi:hypothetical protein
MMLLARTVLLFAVVPDPGIEAAHRSRCERSVVPSPRQTGCSIKTSEKLQQWIEFQKQLAKEAAAFRPTEGRGPPPLILYGDSITEALRGTAIGQVTDRTEGIQQVLGSAFPGWRMPTVLAISADETQHLLWRLNRSAGGELSDAMCNDERLAISLLIGTNNLGNAKHSVADAHAGMMAVARDLLQRTRGKLLVNALLPRSQKLGDAAPSWRKKAFVSLMPSVRRVNALVNSSVRELATEFPGRVRVVDCGHIFQPAQADGSQSWGATRGKAEVNISLMPDALHPNLLGTRLWTACVGHALAPWLPKLSLYETL